jgi:molecular chaperone HtpG
MNQHVIENYYSKIGSSYYKSKDFEDLKVQTGLKFKPISRFGIGILSCFMVSDTIEVETRKLLEDGEKDTPYNLSIEGYDSLFTTKKGSRKEHGTKTRIILREKENPWEKMTNQTFIQYVKQAVPNPPVKIMIVTDKEDSKAEEISIDENTFSHSSASELVYYYWEKSDYIKEITISLADDSVGFRGEAIVAILEKNEKPVGVIEGLYRNVKIEDQQFELENKVRLDKNQILQVGTVIEVGIESEIKTKESNDILVKSKSKFSIHGIDFPTGLFPEFDDRNKPAKLRWHLPMLLVLDVTGTNDIDLNSARTEIVFNENWNRFEQNLAFLVCYQLKSKLPIAYWSEFYSLLLEVNESINFKLGLEKANCIK